MKPTISLAMIVRDAEKTLDKCLSTAKELVDEIIIVDTGSKDKTLEIAGKYTDGIYFFDWINDFAAARNYAFSLCTKDFILWLDADDEVVPEQAKKFKALDLSDKDVVICNYQYAHDEFGVCTLPVPRERILRRSLGLKWVGRIHEVIPLPGTKQFLSDLDFPKHNKQHGTSERNISILEEVVVENPQDSRNIYYLGKEYYDHGRVDQAIPLLEKFVGMPGSFWEDVYHAHDALAQAKLRKGDEEGFKKHLLESIRIEERRAEPFYHMGFFYQCRNQWDKAIQWYEMSLKAVRPKGLLASFQPEYYSWLPRLQLCVCYNAIGEIRKSYEYNREVLALRPRDMRAVGNDRILKASLDRGDHVKKTDGAGKELEFIGVGKNIHEIPYVSGTISAVRSFHSLEHVGFGEAELAIREWFRVLRPGGSVQLRMPDVERCFQAYTAATLENKVWQKTRAWFKMTVYGMQHPDETDVHRCGFSKEEIKIILERNGLMVNSVADVIQDDGIPSMFVEAVKPISNLKIGWISAENWEAAQTRIRVLNVNRWLRSQGYRSEIVNYPAILSQNFDVAIVGKGFDQNHFGNIRWLKRNGKTVYADLCEDIVGWPGVNEILSICDKVICCSRVLAEKVSSVNPNVVVVEDAWESC